MSSVDRTCVRSFCLSACLSVLVSLLLLITPDVCQAKVCELGGCSLGVVPIPGGGATRSRGALISLLAVTR
jgi:hypothetical protein